MNDALQRGLACLVGGAACVMRLAPPPECILRIFFKIWCNKYYTSVIKNTLWYFHVLHWCNKKYTRDLKIPIVRTPQSTLQSNQCAPTCTPGWNLFISQLMSPDCRFIRIQEKSLWNEFTVATLRFTNIRCIYYGQSNYEKREARVYGKWQTQLLKI